eukprot:TRINITY_DN3916_c0_g1_i3.p1 TRINITY_DN3916_c0_g1~~TRINITY_DN3916_c0_g1_i3.p1  ORF type:complete len:582 (+),score=189.80 TRINITY_DN3916_c0_g1_i3:195-1940(+)
MDPNLLYDDELDNYDFSNGNSSISQAEFYPDQPQAKKGKFMNFFQPDGSNFSGFNTQGSLFHQTNPSSPFSPGGVSTPSINFPVLPQQTENTIFKPQPALPHIVGSISSHPKVVEASSHELNKIETAFHNQSEELKKIRLTQHHVLNNPTEDDYNKLIADHGALKSRIDQQLQTLAQLGRTYIFAPHEIHKAFYLHQDLQTQSMQLELYHQELLQLTAPSNPPRCYIALVIIQQPFPMVITKTKALDDPVVVQLMTGANVDVQSISPLQIVVNMESLPPKGTPTKNIENETEIMDESTKLAKCHIKFLNGTRKNIANIKFNMQVQLRNGSTIAVESNPSSPFVVITNECQFEESDGLLLKTESFGNSTETQVPWALFGNLLQRHFLRATRQDPVKPQRFLSRQELQYLSAKFFGGNPYINTKMYDDFWNWFGKGLQKLRYQRHLHTMWQQGLIYGYVPRESVTAALMNQQVGTFLIRMSESNPGAFAIGYVINESDPEKRVRHYLIKNEDVWGPKKTLPDFLMESNQFAHFLRISFDLGSGIEKHQIIGKDIVLENQFGIVVKKENNAPISGYDPNLMQLS